MTLLLKNLVSRTKWLKVAHCVFRIYAIIKNEFFDSLKRISTSSSVPNKEPFISWKRISPFIAIVSSTMKRFFLNASFKGGKYEPEIDQKQIEKESFRFFALKAWHLWTLLNSYFLTFWHPKGKFSFIEDIQRIFWQMIFYGAHFSTVLLLNTFTAGWC